MTELQAVVHEVAADFPAFSKAVTKRFEDMSKHELFTVDAEDLFESYLAAFPEGTNPMFRERTEHDCSCCKHFVRRLGTTVAIIDGNVETVWDIAGLPHPYDIVAATLNNIVRQLPITGIFRTKERRYGNEFTLELIGDTTRRWDHFVGTVAPKHLSDSPDEKRGEKSTIALVFRRGLDEINAEALATVLDLIDSNSIYRGEEHRASVAEFAAVQTRYRESLSQDLFVWGNLDNRAARFRNTVIGTLLTDLSAGEDIETAVRKFEAKVAPTNYKRPKSIITPRMVEGAMKTLTELGLESAVERRFARLTDVSVNNVLFVDNSVQEKMKDGIHGLLLEAATTSKPKLSNPLPISAEEFFDQVVPKARSIDLMVENRHLGNFVSLTAPVNEDVAQLFKWDNNFAWSYDGDVTDSVKQRVKKAGGKVDALLRCSLAWFNKDDLDIHVMEPDGNHISFSNKGGKLDVDMNVTAAVRDAVENVCWDRHNLRDGHYKVSVNNFTKRETIDVGFMLEVEFGGAIQQFTYAAPLSNSETVHAITLSVKKGQLDSIQTQAGVVGGSASTDKWGIATETLVPVDTLMLSPNHWDEQQIGNRHFMFLLKGCRNPDSARGIYNEFLDSKLDKHRKVFEVLGAKTKCPPAEEQLSGIGFSSTRNDKATVLVRGDNIQRAYEIQF